MVAFENHTLMSIGFRGPPAICSIADRSQPRYPFAAPTRQRTAAPDGKD